MTCSYAQYCRLMDRRRLTVAASAREVIAAAHLLLSPEGRSRRQRAARHAWLRSVLRQHRDAKRVYARATGAI